MQIFLVLRRESCIVYMIHSDSMPFLEIMFISDQLISNIIFGMIGKDSQSSMNIREDKRMNKKGLNIRTMVAIGIGAAIFFVLMRFVSIPSGVPNTNLNLAAAILSLFAGIFGPVAGMLIAFIGHTLTDLTWGSGVWWSWVLANTAFGFMLGIFRKKYRIEEGGFGMKEAVLFNVVQIIANLIAWVGIAPSLDILFFQEPANKVYLQGLTAAGLNAAVILVVGTLLAFGYSKTRTKAGSLKEER